jgi:hypothetical protein
MRLIPGLALAVLLTGSGAYAGPVPLKPEDLFRMQWGQRSADQQGWSADCVCPDGQ